MGLETPLPRKRRQTVTLWSMIIDHLSQDIVQSATEKLLDVELNFTALESALGKDLIYLLGQREKR